MGCIYDNGICTSIDKSLHTVKGINGDTNTCCNTQTTFIILACHRLVFCLCYILVCDKTYEMVVTIHYRQLLNLVFLKNLCGSTQICLYVGCYKILRSHHLVNLTTKVTLEAQITVCYDTDKMLFVVNYRYTSDMILCHDIESLPYC